MSRAARRGPEPARRLNPARAARRRPDRLADGLAAAGGLVLIAVVALTFRDYGITWDEPLYSAHGEELLRFYASGGADRSALAHGNLWAYGGLFELLAAGARRALPLDPYDARHLLTAAVGLLGIAACWRMGRRLGGPWAGLWAGVFLAMTPGWWGHLFNNPKDLPFAAACAWGLAALLAWAEAWPAGRLRHAGETGLAVGTALAVRTGGVILAGLAVAAFAGRGVPKPRGAWRRLAVDLAGAGLLAYAVMVAAWPYALLHPLTGPLASAASFSRFVDWDGPILFGGAAVRSTALPWDYAPRLLLLTLPLPLLLGLAAGAGWWILAAWRNRRWLPAPLRPAHAVVAAAAVLPVVFVIVRGSVLYNGVRHLLFILPPLAALGGAAAAGAVSRLRRTSTAVRWTAGASAAFLVASHLATLIVLHPYESVFYNALAGGVPGAFNRYELEYWGASYREAAGALTRRLAAEPSHRGRRVFVCGPVESAMHYLPGCTAVADTGRADFLFLLAGGSCRPPAGPPCVTVERLGVPLAAVYDLRAARRP